ncbi:hypothetical protein CsatB_017736 [Cannabis sativa]
MHCSGNERANMSFGHRKSKEYIVLIFHLYYETKQAKVKQSSPNRESLEYKNEEIYKKSYLF